MRNAAAAALGRESAVPAPSTTAVAAPADLSDEECRTAWDHFTLLRGDPAAAVRRYSLVKEDWKDLLLMSAKAMAVPTRHGGARDVIKAMMAPPAPIMYAAAGVAPHRHKDSSPAAIEPRAATSESTTTGEQ